MEYAKIEQNVDDLLQLSGIENDGLVVRQTLHHMLMCVKLYETLDAEKRERVAKWRKHFQFLIAIRFNLKERKRRKEKKNSPSYSPNKEKPQEAKGENTTPTVCDADSGFDEDLLKRFRAFEAKCEKYVGKYGRDIIDNFVRYWTMPNQETGKMQFEEKTYWRLSSMLESWSSKSYTKNDAAAEKDMTTKLCKKLQYHFETKFSLKERKRKAKKENFPPNPLIKEKQTKEIEENNTHTVCDADSGFDEELLKRYEVFAKKCEKYVGKYGREMIDNFVRYWTLPNQATGKMKFEEETYWRLSSKLESWKNSSFTKNDAAASMRLSKTRGKRQKEGDEEQKSKELAAQREEANARLEEQIEQSKAGAVTREEWLAMKAAR